VNLNAEPNKKTEIVKRWGESPVDLCEKSIPALKIERVLKQISDPHKRMKILDYGCGEGKTIKTLRRLLPHSEIIGTDIQTPLPENIQDIHFIKLNELSQFKNFFDLIICNDVIEHVEDVDQVLAEINDLLKPDGEFIGFVPVEGRLFSFFTFWRLLLGKDLYLQTKDHRNNFTFSTLKTSLENKFQPQNYSYSYHILGGFLDASFFALAKIKSVQKFWWNENPYYSSHPKKGFGARLMKWMNFLCYYESRILQKVSFAANGLHFKMKSKKQIPKGSADKAF
jgi:SAM-dependent methyltransferase